MLIKHIEPLNRSWPIYNQNSSKYVCSVPVSSHRFSLKVWLYVRCLIYCLIILLQDLPCPNSILILVSHFLTLPCSLLGASKLSTDSLLASWELHLKLLLCNSNLNQLSLVRWPFKSTKSFLPPNFCHLHSPLFCFSSNLAFPKHQQPSCPSTHYEKAILSLLAHNYAKEGSEGMLLASQVTSHLKYWQEIGKKTDSLCHPEQVNFSELWCLH